jgi:hypothetical protein
MRSRTEDTEDFLVTEDGPMLVHTGNTERKVIFQNLSSQTSVTSVRDLIVPASKRNSSLRPANGEQ